jgi:hypothetical protein
MKVRSGALAIVVLVAGLAWGPAAAARNLPTAPTAQRAPTAPGPKVAIVVGPVGGVTNEYRQLADEAATAALAFTPNVVRVYTPNATWAAVRAALQDASVVVYLGHGNGWPSRYHKSLYPLTENGFGLNPVAGVDNNAHQYFGEDRVATDISLAPNAVVILSRLCYASGNSEPGLPEGTVSMARQRVDNYAAGFIAAGAGAVIAEGHDGPAGYVRDVLSSDGLIESIWRSAPTFHDHVISFDSVRSPGYVARLDPDQASSGFYRSIVVRPGLTAQNARGNRVETAVDVQPTEATLVGAGLTLSSPTLADRPSVGARTRVVIRYKIADPSLLPDGLRIGVRWDPIDVALPAAPAAPATPAGPGAASAASGTPAAPSPTATGSTSDTSPADEQLIAPEQQGTVVNPATARVEAKRISVRARVPLRQGRYRLVLTLHDSKGDAFDAASQTLIKPVVVRVTGKIDAAYHVAPVLSTTASSSVDLPVTVSNLGLEAWGQQGLSSRMGGGFRLRPGEEATRALVVGRWVPLDVAAIPSAQTEDHVALPAGLAAATKASVTLSTMAPSTPGNYLLLIDVVVPNVGSLAALGIGPQLVRVTVDPSVR